MERTFSPAKHSFEFPLAFPSKDWRVSLNSSGKLSGVAFDAEKEILITQQLFVSFSHRGMKIMIETLAPGDVFPTQRVK